MIRRLRPYFANVQKRLTKSPKLYIRDTGLLHALAGLREARELATWARRGASFEGMVIEELVARVVWPCQSRESARVRIADGSPIPRSARRAAR